LTLLISGGHTLLLLASSETKFRILAGQDVDLSIGRAFDKTSRLLDIRWGDKGPGAALEALAATATELLDDSNFDPSFGVPVPGRLKFSYAGLYSQVGHAVAAAGGLSTLSESQKAIVARNFQRAAVEQLEEKVLLGLAACGREGQAIKHIVVSGGVASNTFLRER
jgi:N6-L-threonylcarbamoyladenine synthase